MNDTITATTIHTADGGHVRVEVIDVIRGQRAALEAAGDPDRQRAIAAERVIEPLRPFWEPLLDNPWAPAKADPDDPVALAAMLSLYPLDGNAEDGLRLLARFEEAASLDACREAVIRAFDLLQPTTHGIELPTVRVTLTFANPETPGLMDRLAGYTGLGGTPGLIHMIAVPTDFNLPRLASATAHEAHHQVRLTFEPWDPETITVGQYYVLEGLAETFAAELYGEDSLGPWTSAVPDDELARVRPMLRAAMERTGDPRPYMFGDWSASFSGYEPIGLPDFIGYTAGYRLVRSYLDATGLTAVEASWKPWREIVAGSPWITA